jgi:glycosyltransferase involved in cell wall biosynthesis
MKTPKLSATVITLNEEKKLSECLSSVKDIADEIILVDSGSTDRTIEIAQKFDAKVFRRGFDTYSNQKNFAANKATGDWILSLDGDEELSDGLREEIKSAVKTEKYNGYSMPRKNIIFGKFIKHSRWQPEFDRHVWLWRKDRAKWVGDVHEELLVDGNVGKLKNAKIHHQYEDVSEFWEMMNRYSEFDTRQRLKRGNRFSLLRLFADPPYNFLVRYFYRLGFLDGWRGFMLSYLMAVYHLEIWVKVWERQNA